MVENERPALTLYQAEWCPHSHAVRLRLTELGRDFIARQVEPERAQRSRMREAIGVDSIPTLVDEDGTIVSGEEPILRHLAERFGPGPAAAVAAHRAKLRDERHLWLAAFDRETAS